MRGNRRRSARLLAIRIAASQRYLYVLYKFLTNIYKKAYEAFKDFKFKYTLQKTQNFCKIKIVVNLVD